MMQVLESSRDHFRGKVEDLCKRLLGSVDDKSPTSAVKEIPAPDGVTLPSSEFTVDTITGNAVAEALRKVQEDLSQLAQTWEKAETDSATKAGFPTNGELQPKVNLASSHASANDATRMQQDPRQLESHLAWLRTQRDALIQSGLYGGDDLALVALDKKIAEAAGRLYGFPSG